MSRPQSVGMLAVLVVIGAANADWILGPPSVIRSTGTYPSVWNASIAFLDSADGTIWLYDGTDSILVYESTLNCYEPALANGVVAWRANVSGLTTNEIYRWAGSYAENISDWPNVSDADVCVGANGDCMWTHDRFWLFYYDADTGIVTNLDTRGTNPALYINDQGVPTYAYQNPDTYDVEYFDGVQTLIIGPGLGQGTDMKSRPSLHDGAIAWIGAGGAGDIFKIGEVFFWRDGTTTRVTDDDAAGGRADDFPFVWNDAIVWQRAPSSASQTRIYFWDGTNTIPLTTTRSLYPGFHGGHVAWVDYVNGLTMATLAPPLGGDCNANGIIDVGDFSGVTDCLAGPGIALGTSCSCGDLNEDGDSDLADYALLQGGLPGLLAGDCNLNGMLEGGDGGVIATCLDGPAVPVAADCVCADLDRDRDADVRDLANAQRALGG